MADTQFGETLKEMNFVLVVYWIYQQNKYFLVARLLLADCDLSSLYGVCM